jgi:hypothetical protein
MQRLYNFVQRPGLPSGCTRLARVFWVPSSFLLKIKFLTEVARAQTRAVCTYTQYSFCRTVVLVSGGRWTDGSSDFVIMNKGGSYGVLVARVK